MTSTTPLTLVNLRCEYQQNPLGLGVRKPRLSWQMQGEKRGLRQTAYRILVSDNAESITQNKGTIWDSKRVTSNQSILVEYGGPSLQSRQRYYWKVIVWDLHNQRSAWSDIAFWEMGLLEAWQASWICKLSELSQAVRHDGSPDPPFYFRREFKLTKQIKSARIYATALGTYELHLNGRRVGDAYFTPGWTSYDKRLQYQTFDVTELLQVGENALGAIVADGWHRGHLMNFEGSTRRNVYGDTPALRLQLHVTYADESADSHDSAEIITTDDQWQSGYGVVQFADHYMGETHDLRWPQQGWSQVGFDTTHWGAVEQIAPKTGKLVAQVGPLVRKMGEIRPKSILTTPTGETIIDFGQNMVGWVQLTVDGPRDTVITLRHAETLGPDGNFYTANLRRAKQTVTYVLDGEGERTLEPRFSFQGFRYVAIDGYVGELTLDRATGIVVYSDMAQAGHFECSDPKLNQLQQNIVWSQRGNFLDLPTDCPQRDERMGWTGDAHIFLPTAAFNMDVAGLFTRWLRDLAADQRADGAFPHVAPNVLGDSAAGAAGWGDAGVLCPWYLYQIYGDKRILKRSFPSMQRWVQFLHNRASESLIWRGDFQFGDWLSVERSEFGASYGKTDDDLIGTAFYAHSTAIVAQVARVLRHDDVAKSYEALAERIRAAFQHEFVTPSGRISGDTQTAYVLALAFDLLPEVQRPEAARRLVENIESRGYHLSTGFLGTPYLCEVLTRFGHIDVAFLLLMQEAYPSWLYPIVEHGATTIWERWDGIRPNATLQSPDMNSFNHYANGSIGNWLYRTVAGLQIDDPGYRNTIIKPAIGGGGLTSASATHQTPYGEIASAWELDEQFVTMRITIPPNTSAIVYFPSDLVTENGQPLSTGDGIYRTAAIDGVFMARIGSGQYEFHVLLME